MQHEALQYAGSMAYFAVLSIFQLLVLGVVVFSFFLGDDRARAFVLEQVQAGSPLDPRPADVCPIGQPAPPGDRRRLPRGASYRSGSILQLPFCPGTAGRLSPFDAGWRVAKSGPIDGMNSGGTLTFAACSKS